MRPPPNRTRRILNWCEPALPQIAATILRDWGSGDLSNVMVVLPTRRAGRLLLRQLAIEGQSLGYVLHPPRLTTPGGIDAGLFEDTPFASPLERRLAWARAIQQLEESEVAKLLGRAPNRQEVRSWLAIADATIRLQSILESVGASFADWRDVADDAEKERAETLLQVEKHYREILTSVGRVDPFAHRRLMLAEDRVDYKGCIYLAATVDLPRAVAKLLDRCADRSAQLHVLIHADTSLTDAFDALGVVRPDYADAFQYALDGRQCAFAENPKDEARRILATISDWSTETSSDDVAVSSLSKETTARLLGESGQIGVSFDWEEGRPATESAPISLLQRALAYGESRSAEDFASLARHADLLARLSTGGEPARGDRMLGELDRFRTDSVAHRMPEASTLPPDSDLTLMVRTVENLITWREGDLHSPGEWARLFSEFLADVYEPIVNAMDAPAMDIHQRELPLAGECLQALASLETIEPSGLSASMAGELLVTIAAEMRIPEKVESNALSLVGWLDLLLEPARRLAIAGMQVGATSTELSHPFLTDRSSEALKLPGREERWARDRYLMSALLASGRDLLFLASGKSSKGDPLLPSRLLLTGSVAERMDKMKSFFEANSSPIAFRSAVGDPIRIKPPAAVIETPISGMSVTAFRDYLACPYRFYLKHVCRLEIVDDAVEELDGSTFGSLVHHVLRMFGESVVRDSSNEEEVFDYLTLQLDMVVRETFPESLPAVQVQVEQLRRRLLSFAQWQAKHVSEGWRIADVEIDLPRGRASLLVDGEAFSIHGRIDRLDIHEARGELAIFDYKAGDAGDKPEAIHRRHEEWVDLQLPLYRHLLAVHPDEKVRELMEVGRVRLGYILLPKALRSVGVQWAEWSEEELATADEAARSVIRRIRSGDYRPTRESVERYYPEFIRICQDGMQRESEP